SETRTPYLSTFFKRILCETQSKARERSLSSAVIKMFASKELSIARRSGSTASTVDLCLLMPNYAGTKRRCDSKKLQSCSSITDSMTLANIGIRDDIDLKLDTSFRGPLL
ncbi:hypothetical protein J6590_106028, partial [Homalodisca vitripennis]